MNGSMTTTESARRFTEPDLAASMHGVNRTYGDVDAL